MANVYRNLALPSLPVVSDMAGIASSYRQAAAAQASAQGKTLAKMSDEQVVAIIASFSGGGDDVDFQRITALVEAEPETLQDEETFSSSLEERMTAYRGAYQFFEFGKMLPASVVQHMEDTADADETLTGAPLVYADDFMKVYATFKGEPGLNGEVINNPILTWPEGGTGTRNRPPRANCPPDHYKVVDEITGKDIKGSVYNDMFEGTSMGAPWKERNTILTSMNGGKVALSETLKARLRQLVKDKAVAEFLDAAIENNDGNAISKLVKWNNNRRGKVVNRIRTAVNFIQQRDRIEAIPHIRVFIQGSIAAASAVKNPIEMLYHDPKRRDVAPDKPPAVSIATFNRYDVAKAIADAASSNRPCTTGDIIATTKKVSPPAGGLDTPNVPPVATVKDLSRFATAVYSYMDKNGDAVLAAANTGSDVAKQLIYNLRRLSDSLDGFTTKTSAQFTVINAELAEEREKASEDATKRGTRDKLIAAAKARESKAVNA